MGNGLQFGRYMRYGQWPPAWEVNEVWAMASSVGGE